VSALHPRCRKTPFAAEPLAVDVEKFGFSLWWADCQGSDGIIPAQYNLRLEQSCSILLSLEKESLARTRASPVRE